MSLVVDVSIAEGVMSGDAQCYKYLVLVADNEPIKIVYSNTWRKQWEGIADAPCHSSVGVQIKDYLQGWISAMIRRSRDKHVGPGYNQSTLQKQCFVQAPCDSVQDAVMDAWPTVELALHQHASGDIFFKGTCPLGNPTPCEEFSNAVVAFTSPVLRKIQWKKISS